MSDYKKWMLLAPLGLVLIGAGLSFAIEAGFAKHNDPDSYAWVGYGTAALIVFNSGLCLFGQSIIHRIRHEREKTRQSG